jgi:O-antigen/teichoic acid export membrane protein
VKASDTRSPFARRQSVSEYHAQSTDPRWKGVYRLGGVAALITVLVALLDILLSFLPGERDVEPGRLSATEWFARFQESRFLALRDLGL